MLGTLFGGVVAVTTLSAEDILFLFDLGLFQSVSLQIKSVSYRGLHRRPLPLSTHLAPPPPPPRGAWLRPVLQVTH